MAESRLEDVRIEELLAGHVADALSEEDEHELAGVLSQSDAKCEELALQLLVCLLEVIPIQMAITTGPDEIANTEVGLLREHVRQQRIRCDVKRHAKKNVAAALVQLT